MTNATKINQKKKYKESSWKGKASIGGRTVAHFVRITVSVCICVPSFINCMVGEINIADDSVTEGPMQ